MSSYLLLGRIANLPQNLKKFDEKLQEGYDEGMAGFFQTRPAALGLEIAFLRDAKDDAPHVAAIVQRDGLPVYLAAIRLLVTEMCEAGLEDLAMELDKNLWLPFPFVLETACAPYLRKK